MLVSVAGILLVLGRRPGAEAHQNERRGSHHQRHCPSIHGASSESPHPAGAVPYSAGLAPDLRLLPVRTWENASGAPPDGLSFRKQRRAEVTLAEVGKNDDDE